MKYLTKLTSLAVTLMVVASCLIPPGTAHASQGSVYFKPGSGKYTVGKSFTVQVWVDVQSETPLYHSSKGAITFPKNLLRATKAVNSNSGADFSLSIKQSQGRVNFNTMLWGNLESGFQSHVFDITFKVTKKGTARLGIATGTVMFNGPTTVRQPTYKLSVPPCPSGQSGTWPNCYKPKPNPKPTPSKPTPPRTTTPSQPSIPKPEQKNSSPDIPPEDTAPLSEGSDEESNSEDNASDYNGLSIGSVTSTANYTSADITWLTSLDATTTFAYGTSEDALNISSEVTSTEQKSYSTSLSNLKPGWTYYYQVDATSDNGYTSYSGQFQAKGYPVTLTVNQNDTPITGATILVGDRSTSYTTDSSGQVSLNLSAGDHDITIKTDNGEAKETINVQSMSIEDGKDPDTQNITISTTLNSTAEPDTGSGTMAVVAILFSFFALCAIGLVVFLKKRSKKSTTDTESQTFDDTFWNNVPGASGMTEDMYGNPVYTGPATEAAPVAEANQQYQQPVDQQYQQPVATETTSPSSYDQQYHDPSGATAYASPGQYYADMSSAQDPSSYGYSPQATNTEYAYPSQDTVQYDSNYQPVAADTPAVDQYAASTPYYDPAYSQQPQVDPYDQDTQQSY